VIQRHKKRSPGRGEARKGQMGSQKYFGEKNAFSKLAKKKKGGSAKRQNQPGFGSQGGPRRSKKTMLEKKRGQCG